MEKIEDDPIKHHQTNVNTNDKNAQICDYPHETLSSWYQNDLYGKKQNLTSDITPKGNETHAN